ncbi:hypothetical protein BDR26DRAFT_852923 [Obelidium mucronatum]|nr:hypothetical protein BDR26DRAFT_852923 [Obelidium mucronatum]
MLTLTEMRAVILSVSVLDAALAVAGQSKKLEHIIVAGVKTIDRTYLERAAALNVTLSTMDSIRMRGKEKALDPVKSEQTDTASIIFEHCSDSGIKGSVLTHSNVAVAISSVYVTLPLVEKLNESDVCLIRSQSGSSFEYTLVYALLFAGAQVAFSNSTSTFLDEISALKPTLLTTSSQHLSIISKAINEHPSAKSFGYKTAVSVKRQELKEGRCWTGTIYDRFLKPIEQGIFGGKLRVIWNLHSEGPPGTDLNDVETIRSVLGTQVLETFSRAEACGLVSSSMYGDYEKANHIGVPAANLEYKLIDAPGKKYFVSDLPNPRGAICIRGPGVSKVYFNDAGKLASVVDEEGWVRLAGAFGEVRPNGTLTLL